MSPANPGFGGIFGDNSQAATNFNYFINDYFLNAVINGEEDLNYLDSLQIHDVNSPKFIIHDNWKNKLDFVGLNYYRRVYVYHDNALALSSANFIGGRFDNGNDQNGQSHGKLNDLGWEIYPQGIHDILLKIKNQVE